MTITYRRVTLSIFAISLMLLGMTLLPVGAAFVPTQPEITEQSLIADENGHSYVFIPETAGFSRLSYSHMVHDEDVDLEKYTYYTNGWDSNSYSYMGPASRQTIMASSISSGYGWLGDQLVMLPVFLDYGNTTNNPLTVSLENERSVFPMQVGEESSIIMEPGIFYFGTFNLTTEEFIHLSISSRTDLINAMVLVMDPEGTMLMEGGINGGNSQIFPFLSSGPGMYTMFVQIMSYDDNLIILDFVLDAVTPIDLPIGGSAEGVLNGSEYFVDTDDGSLIHQEKVPSAVTYKFNTNFTTPGVITHSMNLPEIDTNIYNWYDPWIQITSSASVDFFFDARYLDYLAPNDGPYYYQSFRNETYYLTIGGMENVEYMVHNDYAMIDELPVNEMFYIENDVAEDETRAYTLSLAQDSVLRVNSTEGTYGYSWDVFTVFEDNTYRLLDVIDHSAFGLASIYYLPAGEYLVTADCSDSDAWGFYDFNLGPVIDGLGSVSVDTGALVGLRFDTNALDYYNVSVSFDTHDNVTAGTDVNVLNTFGGTVFSSDIDLGNRQSGLGWIEYNNNFSSWVPNTFCDGFGIVVLSPYEVLNNTGGLPGNDLGVYSVDYTVNVEDGISWVFNGTATISMPDAWYNFTLGEVGDAEEEYLLNIDGEPGQWLNVSIYVEDVADWGCIIYQEVDGTPQYVVWNDLDDTFTGSYTGASSFQFGCISDNVSIYFYLDRTLSGEGRLDIAIDPLLTNTFEYMPPLTFKGEIVAPGVDMGLVALGIGGAVVIVVVIVVILKKKPELLRRS